MNELLLALTPVPARTRYLSFPTIETKNRPAEPGGVSLTHRRGLEKRTEAAYVAPAVSTASTGLKILWPTIRSK